MGFLLSCNLPSAHEITHGLTRGYETYIQKILQEEDQMKLIIISIIIVAVVIGVSIFTPSGDTAMSDADIVAQKNAMSIHAVSGWENNSISMP